MQKVCSLGRWGVWVGAVGVAEAQQSTPGAGGARWPPARFFFWSWHGCTLWLPTQHYIAQHLHYTTQHGTAQNSTALHCTAQHSTAKQSTAQQPARLQMKQLELPPLMPPAHMRASTSTAVTGAGAGAGANSTAGAAGAVHVTGPGRARGGDAGEACPLACCCGTLWCAPMRWRALRSSALLCTAEALLGIAAGHATRRWSAFGMLPGPATGGGLPTSATHLSLHPPTPGTPPWLATQVERIRDASRARQEAVARMQAIVDQLVEGCKRTADECR